MNGLTEDEAKRLMRRARADFVALLNMADPMAFDDNIFGFHAQQAAEKALKAWLTLFGKPYPFRHDLAELLAALEAAGQDTAELWSLVELTPFAVQFRYDDVDPDAGLDRAATANELAFLLDRVDGYINALYPPVPE